MGLSGSGIAQHLWPSSSGAVKGVGLCSDSALCPWAPTALGETPCYYLLSGDTGFCVYFLQYWMVLPSVSRTFYEEKSAKQAKSLDTHALPSYSLPRLPSSSMGGADLGCVEMA